MGDFPAVTCSSFPLSLVSKVDRRGAVRNAKPFTQESSRIASGGVTQILIRARRVKFFARTGWLRIFVSLLRVRIAVSAASGIVACISSRGGLWHVVCAQAVL